MAASPLSLQTSESPFTVHSVRPQIQYNRSTKDYVYFPCSYISSLPSHVRFSASAHAGPPSGVARTRPKFSRRRALRGTPAVSGGGFRRWGPGGLSVHYGAKTCTLRACLMFCVHEAGREKWLTYFIKNNVDDGLNAECDEIQERRHPCRLTVCNTANLSTSSDLFMVIGFDFGLEMEIIVVMLHCDFDYRRLNR